MMEIELLLNTIKNMAADMEVNVQTVQKGNVCLTGISIGKGDVHPMVYPKYYEDLFNEQGYMAVAQEMINSCKEAIKNSADINNDINKKATWDYAKDHLMLCIQPAGTDRDFITIPYLDLELYFRVKVSNGGTYKVTQRIFDTWGITKETLLETAFGSGDYIKKSMIDMMAEMGMPDEMLEEMRRNETVGQTIITNQSKMFSASALYHKEILKEIAEMYKSDLYIIPSSIHELITLPMKGATVEDMNQMVREVNETQVAPEEVLSDHVYIFRRNTMDIEW